MQNLKPLILKCDWVVFLLLCRRPLAADGWCPAGGVWPCQEGWSGQAGCDQGAPDLLSASDLTRLTSLLLRGEHTKGFVWKMTAVLCFQDAYLCFFPFLKTSILIDCLYPLVYGLCEELLECHYVSFEG